VLVGQRAPDDAVTVGFTVVAGGVVVGVVHPAINTIEMIANESNNRVIFFIKSPSKG
jgi:hypothetical protein